jgi:hypothetical protein
MPEAYNKPSESKSAEPKSAESKSAESGSTETKAQAKAADEALKEEISKLRARVGELQDELARRDDTERDQERRDAERRRMRRERERRLYRDDVYYDDRRSREDTITEASDVLRDLPSRAFDEGSKFVRGLTLAYLEQLRTMADVLTTFTDEVVGRNRPETRRGSVRASRSRYAADRPYRRGLYDDDYRERSARRTSEYDDDYYEDRPPRREFSDRSTPIGLAANLPGDIFSGIVSAVDASLDMPRRVVDRFYDAYRESDELEPTRAERDLEDADRALYRAERELRERSRAEDRPGTTRPESKRPDKSRVEPEEKVG